MTEFGAMANNSRGIANMQYLTGQADRHLSSWTYWQFKGEYTHSSCTHMTSSPFILHSVSVRSHHNHVSFLLIRFQRHHHIVASDGRVVLRRQRPAGGEQGTQILSVLSPL
jgi:hypothetical protein